MKTALTDRELGILRLIASGASNAEIAHALHLTEGTVKWYNRQIFAKLGARNRVEAIRAAGGAGGSELAASATRPRGFKASDVPDLMLGRESELAESLSLIRANRLVTLLAPGGMGKSTLARATADAARTEFTDGSFHVPLAALESSEDIPAAIATSCGITIGSGLPVLEQVLLHFHDREGLLVLDNFERLVDGALIVRRLLDAAPAVRVLATSRERLGLQDEVLVRLGGLPVPSEGGSADNPAVRLFFRHAQRVAPTLRLDAPTLSSVARICRLAEGMPLAIMLAATWVGTLSVQEIALEMSRGIDILATRLRDVPGRHKSIQSVIDQTWARLDAEAQHVFAGLSVFRGGFTRAAAAAVTSASVLTLRTLVEHSLIRREDDRYAIHELLRQYGARQLSASGQAEKIDARHQMYFLSWVASEVRDPAAVEPDFENVRRAWEHAVSGRDESSIGSALSALISFCESAGRMADLARLCDIAADGRMSRALRCRILEAGALAHTEMGEFSRGDEGYAEARRIAGEDGDTCAELRAFIGNADVLCRARRLEQATNLATRAISLAQAAHDVEAEADALFHLGRALWYGGNEPQAYETMRRSVDLVRSLNITNRVAIRASYGLGVVSITSGGRVESAGYFQRALALAQDLGHRSYEAEIIESQGWAWLIAKVPDQANQAFSTALELADRANLHWVGTAARFGFALSSACDGDYARAYELAQEALGMAQRIGVGVHRALTLHAVAMIYGDLGMPIKAEAARSTACDLMAVHGSAWLVDIQSCLAVNRVQTNGDTASALVLAESALACAKSKGQYGFLPHAADAVCQVSAAGGDWARVLDVALIGLTFCEAHKLTGHIAILEGHRGAALLALDEPAAAIQSLQIALAHAESHGLVRTQIDLHRTFEQACAATENADAAALHHRRASELIAQIRHNVRDIPELAAGMNL